MRFHIVTLFPDTFSSYLGESILKRALEDKKIEVKFYNPRDFTDDKHKRIDRAPYGGGPGMVIQAEPIIHAIEKAYSNILQNIRINKKNSALKPSAYSLVPKIIWLSPSGKQFDTKIAKTYSKKYTDIIFICGRYEGLDARIKKVFKAEEISVGPFVLTGGELPAMIIMDCVSRQIEGVLGDINSLEENRIASPDVYTRPESFKYKGKNYKVPKVLLSGHHQKIEEWKVKNSKN